MQVGGIVGKHVGSREQLDGAGNLAALDGPRGVLDLALAVGHGSGDLWTLGALGEGA